MFAAVRNFLYRHRRKFVVLGVAVGGITLLGKFAQRRILAWQDEQAKLFMEQHKRRQHYECTLDCSRRCITCVVPSLKKVLEIELDAEVLIKAIQDQPEKKKVLWEQLKLVGFGRAVSMIICSALVVPVNYVMMMILAANTLDSSNDPNTNEPQRTTAVSQEVHTRYFSCWQNLIEEQIPLMVSKIMELVSNTCTSLPLTRSLTLQQLETLLQHITTRATSAGNRNAAGYVDDRSTATGALLPWSLYFQEPEPIHNSAAANKQLMNMYVMTIDILNTDDFNNLVNALIQIGLNYTMDEAAQFFPHIRFPATITALNVTGKNENLQRTVQDSTLMTNKLSETCGSPEPSETCGQETGDADVQKQSCSLVQCSEIDGDSKISPQVSKMNPEDDQELCIQNCSIVTNGTHEQVVHSSENAQHRDVSTNSSASKSKSVTQNSCMVAKLIPVLSGMLHKALPTPRAGFSQAITADTSPLYCRLLECPQLEALALNIYETLVRASAEL